MQQIISMPAPTGGVVVVGVWRLNTRLEEIWQERYRGENEVC